MNKNYFSQFDLLYVGIFVVDQEYNVIFWNKTISEWTKIEKKSIEGKKITDFFPNLLQKKYARRLDWLLDGGPPIIFSPQLHPNLIKCPLSDSKNRTINSTVSNISSGEDKKRLLFTIEDKTQIMDQILEISQLRKSALNDLEERKKMESELLQSRKNEAIRMISHGFAHDFNNLLTIIAGNISLLAIKQSFTDESKKIIKKIENSIYEASKLTKRLISFTPDEKSQLDKKPINSASLLSNVKIIDNDKNINFNIEIKDGVYHIYGNETQLLKMLNIIIKNAFESIEESGNIDILSENTEIKHDNNLNIPIGNYVKISIKDTGCGISEENIDKVFDPYFSTKTEVTKKGLGFGLSIALSIIKSNNGHISIISKKNEGTTVIILLQSAENLKQS